MVLTSLLTRKWSRPCTASSGMSATDTISGRRCCSNRRPSWARARYCEWASARPTTDPWEEDSFIALARLSTSPSGSAPPCLSTRSRMPPSKAWHSTVAKFGRARQRKTSS